ncbi:MAG: serine/threonine-protein kinase [Longimicrobiales bacterium]|nr:serine/threonine-protein kinase [Longimicrobiales bacterium]
MSEQLERLRSVLGDRYALERELGAGGMATVYLAEDLKHHRKVALKVLRPDLAMTLGSERFLREVTIAANLQHPHILPLYDSGEAGGFLYYVMPYVEGPTLRDRLDRERELPVAEAARILRDVADAMAAAHAKGVVHRDLKPENIMLSGRHAMVADFGVAKAVSEATGRNRMTTEGVALGTPTYMAPEQAAADPLTDHRADIYALGVLAYEMLTGQPPFVRGTPQALLAAHVTEAPVAVTERRGTIPPALAQLIMHCLEKKPADRPQRAEELLAVLEGLATPSGGMTPTGMQPVTGVAAPVSAGRRKLLVGSAAVVVVALVAAGAWALLGRGGPLPDARQLEPVVVLPFEVQGGDGGLGVQAADRISGAIQQAGLGEVVRYRPEAGAEPFTERVGRRVLRETRAGTLVVGTIAQRGEGVEVQASVIRGSDLKTVWTLGPERGMAADPTPALDAIRERVLGAVGWYLSPATEGAKNPGIYQPPPSLEVLRLAERVDELMRSGAYARALPLLQETFARDTTYLDAVVSEWWAAFNTLQRDFGAQRWRLRDSIGAYLEARRERLYPGDALIVSLQQSVLGSPEQEYRAAIAHFAADSSQAFRAMWSSIRARRPEEALRYYALRDTTTVWGSDWQAWDYQAALAYHMLGRFEEELALARAAKAREPRAFGHWQREVTALAALGRVQEIEAVITESHGLETQGAPVRLTYAAAREFSFHGRPEEARAHAERVVTGVELWSDSVRALDSTNDIRRAALRILGRHDEVLRIYDEQSRRAGADSTGLEFRINGMRDRILMGDTVGALALVDSARTQPLTAYASGAWSTKGTPLYYAAHILASLGRKDEAVAMLRESLNNGWRLVADEALQWYWAALKDYPPFQELVKLRDGG